MSLVQLFVNGTLVFGEETDEVDLLLLKVDGTQFFRRTNESQFTYCAAGTHLVPKLDRPLPCLYCLHAEGRNDLSA